MSVHGPSLADGHELLGRRIARREDRRHRRRASGHGRARRAEIDQRRPALVIDHDVGRLDVAVQEADGMHLLQPVEQREEQPLDRLRRQPLLAHQALGQRLALDQRHHHVGGAVGLEEVVAPARWPACGRAAPGCAPRRGSARGPRRTARHGRASAAARWCGPRAAPRSSAGIP